MRVAHDKIRKLIQRHIAIAPDRAEQLDSVVLRFPTIQNLRKWKEIKAEADAYDHLAKHIAGANEIISRWGEVERDVADAIHGFDTQRIRWLAALPAMLKRTAKQTLEQRTSIKRSLQYQDRLALWCVSGVYLLTGTKPKRLSAGLSGLFEGACEIAQFDYEPAKCEGSGDHWPLRVAMKRARY